MPVPPPSTVRILSFASLAVAVAASAYQVRRQQGTGGPALYARVQEWKDLMSQEQVGKALAFVEPGQREELDALLERVADRMHQGVAQTHTLEIRGDTADTEIRIAFEDRSRRFLRPVIRDQTVKLVWHKDSSGTWLIRSVARS